MSPLAAGFLWAGIGLSLIVFAVLASLWLGHGKKSSSWAMLAPIVAVPIAGWAVVAFVCFAIFR